MTLFEGWAARPRARLTELPVLDPAERRQLLVDWNATAIERRDEPSVNRQFVSRARQTPDAVAVVAGGETLSYGELDRLARRLARRLEQLGAGLETRIGILLERRPRLIVALLAVLGTGAAYVPFDPRIPSSRLARLLADARASLLICDAPPEELPATVRVVPSAGSPAAAPPPSARPPRAAPPEDGSHLAYLLYTSGSTGSPKSVMIEHRALVDYCHAAADASDLRPGERVLQFASISFDTSAEEIFPTLLHGATLVLRDDDMLDFERLLAGCGDHRVSVLDLPTAHWHELTRFLEAEDRGLPPSVRLVIVGGEAASPRRLAAWHRQVADNVLLVNTYGPTEATIVATQCLLSAPTPRPTASGNVWPVSNVWPSVSIGRPRANTQVYVLSAELEPLAPGMAGTLHLAGRGLARGYAGRPACRATASWLTR